MKNALEIFSLYKFWKSFVFFTVFGLKRGQGKWHLAIKSFMFLESVNKNKPGNLCFKEIQKTWCFLTNPTDLMLPLFNHIIENNFKNTPPFIFIQYQVGFYIAFSNHIIVNNFQSTYLVCWKPESGGLFYCLFKSYNWEKLSKRHRLLYLD